MKPSYHTKAANKFLKYLQDHFQVYTPVTLHLQPTVTFPTIKGKEVTHKEVQGTAQLHKDGSVTIRISTTKRGRRGILGALAHEFGHVVQYSKGFKPDARKVDWRKELEATQLGLPLFIKFMKEHYNTEIHWEPLQFKKAD